MIKDVNHKLRPVKRALRFGWFVGHSEKGRADLSRSQEVQMWETAHPPHRSVLSCVSAKVWL